MNTVNKRKLLKVSKFKSINLYHVKNPHFFFVSCFFPSFFNRSIAKYCVITNNIFPYNHSVTKQPGSIICLYVMFVAPHIVCVYMLSVRNKL